MHSQKFGNFVLLWCCQCSTTKNIAEAPSVDMATPARSEARTASSALKKFHTPGPDGHGRAKILVPKLKLDAVLNLESTDQSTRASPSCCLPGTPAEAGLDQKSSVNPQGCAKSVMPQQNAIQSECVDLEGNARKVVKGEKPSLRTQLSGSTQPHTPATKRSDLEANHSQHLAKKQPQEHKPHQKPQSNPLSSPDFSPKQQNSSKDMQLGVEAEVPLACQTAISKRRWGQ